MEGDGLINDLKLHAACQAKPVDFARVRSLVLGAYAAETGQDADDLKAVASWLSAANRLNPDFNLPHADFTVPMWLMYPDLATKVRQLTLRPCHLCEPFQTVSAMWFTLRTDPLSRQDLRHTAFKSAIKKKLDEIGHDFSDFYDRRLCVALTFALRKGTERRDLDNMAKNMLDALQGHAYANDNQVVHLDLLRCDTSSRHAFISVRLAITGIADNVDVIRPEFDVTWVTAPGSEPIDLTPFL